jgi:hypothetical protein
VQEIDNELRNAEENYEFTRGEIDEEREEAVANLKITKERKDVLYGQISERKLSHSAEIQVLKEREVELLESSKVEEAVKLQNQIAELEEKEHRDLKGLETESKKATQDFNDALQRLRQVTAGTLHKHAANDAMLKEARERADQRKANIEEEIKNRMM